MADVYEELKAYFDKIEEATVNAGKGAQGIKHNGKMFAMFYKGDLTLKFAPERVQELIASGEGEPHDPGTGKPMKDRVLILAAKHDSWTRLTEESLKYVSGK